MSGVSIWGASSSTNINVSGTVAVERFTATAGQTLFTLSNFTYTVNSNSIVVFINGQKQISGVDFSETSSSSFTLTSAIEEAGDVVEVLGFPELTLQAVTAGTVTVTKSETGAVGRSLLSIEEECLSALDFGCDNTGATNTTASLLAFYNACINSGKSGHIPAGTYKLTTGVLVFDSNQLDVAWPEIRTDGYLATNFVVDAATATDAPLLKWKNGTPASATHHVWRGGSHGGITITDSTGATATSRHGISLTGVWGIKFGACKFVTVRGNCIDVPQNLYGGTNPDPYATSWVRFDCIEADTPAGYVIHNDNFVGMDSWDIGDIYAFGCGLGGIYGIGSGCSIRTLTVANSQGWAFDDGTNAGATGGPPQRNWIDIAELDNVQNGIRLNKSSYTDFRDIRFVHRYNTSPNTSLNYYPRTAVDCAGGAAANINNCRLQLFHRIEAGGVLANLGTFYDGHSSGNVAGLDIEVDFADNGGLGVTDSLLFSNVAGSSVTRISKRTHQLVDLRDKGMSFATGSAATTAVINSGWAGVTNKLVFETQLATTYSTPYNTGTYTYTAEKRGPKKVRIVIPLAVAIGTKVRLGIMLNGSLYDHRIFYSVNAGTVHYVYEGRVEMSAGDTLYAVGDQNTGTASISASPVSTNQEVQFVVEDVGC